MAQPRGAVDFTRRASDRRCPILADAAARRGPVLDLRSRVYQAVGRPTGLDDQTATLRIRPSPGGPAHIGDVIAKRVRGEAASHLLSSEADPEDPLDIADLLATRWSLEVEPPGGRNHIARRPGRCCEPSLSITMLNG